LSHTLPRNLADDALLTAMRLVFTEHRLLVEPAGVAGLAALITFTDKFRGATVAIPLCGANLTAHQIRMWLM
jgi:threonine dehydratase